MNLYWIRIDALDRPCLETLRRLAVGLGSPVRRYRFPEDELRHLAGLGLAALAAVRDGGAALLPALRRTPEGKPYFLLAGRRFEFSVSHSGEYAVCLTGREAVGVDVERIAAPPEDIAPVCFTQGELRYLSRASARERPGRFFSLWCMKESILKARGSGLLDDPRGIECVDRDGVPRRVVDGWRVGVSGAFPGHSLAWCGGFGEDGCAFVPVTPRSWENSMDWLTQGVCACQ